MKNLNKFVLAILAGLSMNLIAVAGETNSPAKAPSQESGGNINLVNVPVSEVLDIYAKMAAVELKFDQQPPWAAINFKTTKPLTRPEAIQGIEKVLREQAGIVLIHLDNKRVTVTYNGQSALRQHGKSQAATIVLTSKDVYTNSVRVITQPINSWQNLTFRYVGKTSAEIEAIAKSHPSVQVMKDGVVVAETDGGCASITKGHTNYVGLVLLFSKYDQAKLAEKALRGD